MLKMVTMARASSTWLLYTCQKNSGKSARKTRQEELFVSAACAMASNDPAQAPLALIKLVHRVHDQVHPEQLGACAYQCSRVASCAPERPRSGILLPSAGSTAGLAGELEFSDFFSLRRPKHVFAGARMKPLSFCLRLRLTRRLPGLSSGVQSAAKGTASGAACLVGVPAVGAYAVRTRARALTAPVLLLTLRVHTQGGLGGFMGGMLAGAVSAAVLPVVGVSVGAAQIVRGLAATPEAVYEPLRGKRWCVRHTRVLPPAARGVPKAGSAASLSRAVTEAECCVHEASRAPVPRSAPPGTPSRASGSTRTLQKRRSTCQPGVCSELVTDVARCPACL